MCDTSEKICIGFIGLGLIGGSIAKTLRKVHPEYKLMAYCRTKATIEEAIQEGVIDIALEERDDRFADCDYIFLCAPVSTNISYLPFVKGIAKPGCIITDVGSVKGEIHQAVETLGMTHQLSAPSDGRLRKDGIFQRHRLPAGKCLLYDYTRTRC